MKNVLSMLLLWGLCTAPSFAQNNQSLREKIDQLIPDKNSAIGIAIGGPNDRDTLTYGGNASFPIESALPFHVSLAIMDRIDKGMMKLGDKIPMGGFNVGTSSKNTDAPTLKELITILLQTGDPHITEILIRQLGGTKELSRFLKSAGVRDVMIVTEEKDRRQDSIRIYTHTPLSAIQLLRKFHDKNLLSEKSQQFLLSLLNSNPSEKSIASSLPAGSKTIEIANGNSQVMGLISLPDGRTCSMAIFIADSIMTDGLKEKLVSNVTKATWEFYAEKAMENFRLQYDYTAAIDSLLKVQEKKKHPFNGSILISQGGRRMYLQMAGYSDLKQKTNWLPTDQFAIAQLSDQILATLVLLEAEKGKLDIQQSIGNYLTDLQQDWIQKVTIRHLLTHTDGLVSTQLPPVFTPGNQYQINPAGQELIIKLLEKTTGITVPNLSANLFERLKMNNTAAPELKVNKSLVKSYRKNEASKWIPAEKINELGWQVVGYLSTASDLAVWNLALHNQKVFADTNSYRQLVSFYAVYEHPMFGSCQQGLGLLKVQQSGTTYFAQNGNTAGFNTMNVYYPATQTSVIVLSNASEEEIGAPLLEIINKSSLAVKIAKK
jgi:CubicO group peptidase (beta-lactamase class C family)